MADIFLSYASEDRPDAENLATMLIRCGFSVWWDRQIPPGKAFDEVIDGALRDAACVIVLWSSRSITSRWVKNEASAAYERGVLVPVLIEAVTPPLAFRDIQAAHLINWDPERDQTDFNILLSRLRELVHGSDRSSGPKAGPDAESGSAPRLDVGISADRSDTVVNAGSRFWFFADLFPPSGAKRLRILLLWQLTVSWVMGLFWVLIGNVDIDQFGEPNAVKTLLVLSMTLVATSLWLGGCAWRNRFILGVFQGWLYPVLAFALAYFIWRSVVPGRLWFMLRFLPIPISLTIFGIITLGGVRSIERQVP